MKIVTGFGPTTLHPADGGEPVECASMGAAIEASRQRERDDLYRRIDELRPRPPSALETSIDDEDARADLKATLAGLDLERCFAATCVAFLLLAGQYPHEAPAPGEGKAELYRVMRGEASPMPGTKDLADRRAGR